MSYRKLLWIVPIVVLVLNESRGSPDETRSEQTAQEAQPAGAKPQSAKPKSDRQIEALLEPIREKHKLPGMVAGIVTRRGLLVAGAVGARKLGAPEPITVNDQLHLGSDTKAMTATLLGRFVDESKFSWRSTVGEVFRDFKSEIHPDFEAVTLEQLLTHRAGLPANLPYVPSSGGSLVEQREALAKKALGSPPLHPPGSKYLYSNIGYIIAGHFAERAAGKPWEELMRSEIFDPLGMSSAGFGAPGTKGGIDQPWGHGLVFGTLVPLQMDVPVIGPAGTVHCSLADWAAFVALHLNAARGEARLLKPETFSALHDPVGDQDYVGGWVIVERPWAGGRALTHSGSNTMWYVTAWLAPEREVAYLAATNAGGSAAQTGCDEAIAALIEHRETSLAAQAAAKLTVEVQTTAGGTRFGVLGPKPTAPAPTLFVFAHELTGTLESDDYNKIGRLLAAKGFVCVSLDLPCHGRNVRAGEPQGLEGWAARLHHDEDPISPFLKQASEVLDHLIAAGYADREHIAACGTSRGGFVALHFAAAEPRIRCVAAFAPVTELPVLREFKGLESHGRTAELALSRHADGLAGRPVWLCIGNDDERVGTDQAIAFTRGIVAQSRSQQKRPLVELHVMTSAGHRVHPTAHADAAAWVAEQMRTVGADTRSGGR